MVRKVSQDNNGCICGPRMESFIQPCLLLLLFEKEAHGYELLDSIKEFGFDKDLDPGMVYRNLRKLEKDQAVTSVWDTGNPGPARRIYNITSRGRDTIHHWHSHIIGKIKRLHYFIKRYNANFNEGSEDIV